MVADCGDMELVTEAVNGVEVLAKTESRDIDVVLLDISMPGPTFLETMRRLRTERPGLAILVLSLHPEDQYAVRALRAGASGYLTKDQTPAELAEAIRRVYRGGKYISATLAESLALGLTQNLEKSPQEQLSDREFEVLGLLGSGHGISEIAARLFLSPKTISTYRARIMQKLQLKSNAAIVRYALEHALVE